jgi:hypothetical protein
VEGNQTVDLYGMTQEGLQATFGTALDAKDCEAYVKDIPFLAAA